MGSVDDQISNANDVICTNIAQQSTNRGLLSQNVLSQIRNLVEAILVRAHRGEGASEFEYKAVGPALKHARDTKPLHFLARFHGVIQESASHFTVDGDGSERLMLKYFEYLQRLRDLVESMLGVRILHNLEMFPIDLDRSMEEFHRKIAEALKEQHAKAPPASHAERYYISAVRPFFVDGRPYYEITFYNALGRAGKTDRLVGFSDIEVDDKYAAVLALASAEIEALDRRMPITLIVGWQVSIRPCELSNFARIFGYHYRFESRTPEYKRLMDYLTDRHGSLIELVQLPHADYQALLLQFAEGMNGSQLAPVLTAARWFLLNNAAGVNLVRYLMLRMNNEIIKKQVSDAKCKEMSGLRVQYGCIPFETMPFCTSLPGHNPRFTDLRESVPVEGREHELLARAIKINVERRGLLYTPVDSLPPYLGDIDALIERYNSMLYVGHARRRIERAFNNLFIREFEDDTVEIIERLQHYAGSGIKGYGEAVTRWVAVSPSDIDDPIKVDALIRLFSASRVAVVYGAAGTGKSTMVNHIAHYFNDMSKLFLAHTNPAVDNLRRRVTAQNSTFKTISSHVRSGSSGKVHDLLVIDECSTVGNADLLRVLKTTRFKLLVLVGDEYQIESIEFGNWFGAVRGFLPKSAVFELTTPYRTRNDGLVTLWGKVRRMDSDITEWMARRGYSSPLSESLLHRTHESEIVLCLNYDGIYGINNINRFLQACSQGHSVEWNAATYRTGDPVLFGDSDRFRPLIYNNLKGRIVDITRATNRVLFDVELDRSVTSLDVEGLDLSWVTGSTVRFAVSEQGSGDEDNERPDSVVPFQVAYAVSIHKAQGLEYDSVKVVITKDNEGYVSHNAFYTAITRARERLEVFWTPETQHKVVGGMERRSNHRDVSILSQKRGLSRRS